MPLMSRDRPLVVAPFGDGWCVRMAGAITPSFMHDDLAAACDWATQLAAQLHVDRVEVHDRSGRTTEVLTI